MERSRFVTVALVILSVLTVANARHLFTFSITQVLVVASVALSVHVISLLCASRPKLQPITPLISFAFLIEVLLIINSGGTFSKMMPLPSTIVDLIHDVREGIVAMRSSSAPFAYSSSIFLVTIIGAWVIAEIGETLAQRIHSSAPTLIWYSIVNASLVTSGTSLYITVAVVCFCAAAWFFLYAFDKGHERSRSHVIAIPRSSHVSNSTTYLFTFIALIALSTLLVTPLSSIPSLAPKNLFDFLNHSNNRNELSPLVGMREQLTSKTTETLFTATASEAQYWRTNVLNDFDGESWTSSSKTQNQSETIPSGVITREGQGSVQLTSLEAKFLPTFYSVQSLSTRKVSFLHGSVVYSNDSDIKNYDFSSVIPPSELSDEQIAQSSGKYPASIRPYTLLPISFDDDNPIVKQAQSIASNRGSLYEQVIALRNFFLDDSFAYDLSVDYSSSTDAMEQFLKDRRGFCEQFATTYAVFARSVGIPSRVVVGFTPGEPNANGTFTITNKQAHAWVEVYLSNFGWLTIDPTPSGPAPGQAPSNIGAVVTTTTTTAPPPTSPPSVTESSAPASTTPREEKVTTTTHSSQSLMPVILLVACAGGVMIAFVLYRRKRKHSTKNDQIYIVDTFTTLGQRILEMPPQPDLTIAELVEHVPENNEVIREFLALLTLASYAPGSEVSLDELRTAAAKARGEKIS